MCGYVSDKQWTRLRCRRSDSSARELKAEGFTGSIPLLPSGRIEKGPKLRGPSKVRNFCHMKSDLIARVSVLISGTSTLVQTHTDIRRRKILKRIISPVSRLCCSNRLPPYCLAKFLRQRRTADHRKGRVDLGRSPVKRIPQSDSAGKSWSVLWWQSLSRTLARAAAQLRERFVSQVSRSEGVKLHTA